MGRATDFTTIAAPLSRGELARRAGCSIETIRFYEKIGLLPEPMRSPGGHRRYRAADQRRLRFILRARELGFSIDEIRGLLALADGRGGSCAEVRAMTLDHLDAVRRKIADLRRLESTLERIAAECTGDEVPECPVVEALWSDGKGGAAEG